MATDRVLYGRPVFYSVFRFSPTCRFLYRRVSIKGSFTGIDRRDLVSMYSYIPDVLLFSDGFPGPAMQLHELNSCSALCPFGQNSMDIQHS